MSAVAAMNPVAADLSPSRRDGTGASSPPYEHLHVHLVRTHWASRYHENLGAHLQDALDLLDREGWEVVTSFVNPGNNAPELIVRRCRMAAS